MQLLSLAWTLWSFPTSLSGFSHASPHLFLAWENTVTLWNCKIRSLSWLCTVTPGGPCPADLSLFVSYHLPLLTGFQLHWLPCWWLLQHLKHLHHLRATPVAFPSVWKAPVPDKCTAYSLTPSRSLFRVASQTTLGEVALLSLSIHLPMPTFLPSTFIFHSPFYIYINSAGHVSCSVLSDSLRLHWL